jgi:hypothetical protein
MRAIGIVSACFLLIGGCSAFVLQNAAAVATFDDNAPRLLTIAVTATRGQLTAANMPTPVVIEVNDGTILFANPATSVRYLPGPANNSYTTASFVYQTVGVLLSKGSSDTLYLGGTITLTTDQVQWSIINASLETSGAVVRNVNFASGWEWLTQEDGTWWWRDIWNRNAWGWTGTSLCLSCRSV